MIQERFLDLEQQKKFLTYLNKELKNQVVVLENQKEVLADVLEKGISSNPPKASRAPDFKMSYVMTVSLVLLIGTIATSSYLLHDLTQADAPLKTRYLTENLKGDTVDTWKFWKLSSRATLVVGIQNADVADANKINAIKDAILSDKTITIDDSLTHKGLDGHASTYFVGWRGALENTAETKYPVPTRFEIIESDDGVGDIVITLSTAKDQDGYSGFTKSTVDGNEILKSQITVYDVNDLSDEMLAAIIRHEFGHAIGLGHSTAPEDLMASQITTQYPYISECDVSAISNLYDGVAMDSVVCEK